MVERVDVEGVVGIGEFAGLLGKAGVRVNRNTVWRWVEQGKLDCVRVGRRWYVRRVEVGRIVRFGLDLGAGPGVGEQGGGDLRGRREEVELSPGVLRERAGARARYRVGGPGGAAAYCERMGI